MLTKPDSPGKVGEGPGKAMVGTPNIPGMSFARSRFGRSFRMLTLQIKQYDRLSEYLLGVTTWKGIVEIGQIPETRKKICDQPHCSPAGVMVSAPSVWTCRMRLQTCRNDSRSTQSRYLYGSLLPIAVASAPSFHLNFSQRYPEQWGFASISTASLHKVQSRPSP